ncbi:angiotensin-converting enzyme-like [Ciona intestinalis]
MLVLYNSEIYRIRIRKKQENMFRYLVGHVTLLILLSGSAKADLQSDAVAFAADYTTDAAEVYYNSSLAAWNYQTGITEENLNAMNAENVKSAAFTKMYGEQAKQDFPDTSTLEESEQRQIDSIKILGTANLNEADLNQYNDLTGGMEATYSTATVTMPDGRVLNLDPDLTALMATSRDYNELKYAWKGWYEAAGRPIREDYETFVALSNKASVADGFTDTGEYWRSWYEMNGQLEATVDALWAELQPLYTELHAYVRRKLYEKYGSNYINLKAPIPAHLLGNMWAQQWGNIYDLVEPYSGKTGVDATPAMQSQGYDAMKMFKTSEEFFVSLGLDEMTDEFWANTMFVKPTDRDVVCHASAWDFYNKVDFRIKMCTVVNMEDLITIHHEMGHIQYYQQYKDQPIPFRGGANPGFHEAVGDTLALSVSTPKHLNKIGLLDKVEEDDEADINYLLSQAMDKIAFLPFGLMIDKWRWSVFSGDTPKAKYQDKWDQLRKDLQGITPPVERDGTTDFDPGAKYHVPANTPYIRYFVSFVVQFQFYKSMCDASGHQGPLYKCDFYQSKEAGAKLQKMLELGSSKPWQFAMNEITGSEDMSTLALQEYFDPLTTWLKQKNLDNGDTPGWTDMDWRPMGYKLEDSVVGFLDSYNSSAEDVYFKAVSAEWEYNTNINDQTQAASGVASQEQAQFNAEQAVLAKQYDPLDISDPTNTRLIEKLSVVGTGALPDADLQALTEVNSKMQTKYSTAKACGVGDRPDTECIPLDPDLTSIMATSKNYNELRDAWITWRGASGAMMRDDYNSYIDLENEAAVLNNYHDMGEYWRADYETPDIEEQLEKVWQEMLPLYQELHAYTRRKLYNYYGSEVINLNGPIPAHLLGNMWAQSWLDIYDLVEPYSGKSRPDATPGLQQQGWDAKKMFHVADDFFGDMGLMKCPDEFWSETMFTKPEGREVVCHASAWDFYNRKDFRIKMCTEINQNDFVTIHHELGHIQYFMQYQHLPVTFRDGANPGFHEAVGDTLALSVGTLQHMYKLGLIDEPTNDLESDINYLMSVALDKLAFIPFGYLMDKWRWDVFSGRISKANMNQGWWDYRVKYQGVTPPQSRDETDFDPGAKFHIANNVPYIRYFVSTVVQFQFYESLCKEANHTGDLFKCDFNGTKAAGDKLGAMLRLGSSVTWEDALEQITGSREMTSASLVNYFTPLLDFLKEENKKNNDVVGWPDYSWEPPTNTLSGNGKVLLDNAGSTAKPGSLTIIAFVFFLITRVLLE